ncbi:MAG: YdcF family protein [Lachnospiraceae bacterium]|nr:YdcF family protein [Lachnospiraceae bacterium]
MTRFLCLIAGLACIVLFIPPVVMYKIVNLGNATGLAVGIILLIYGLFTKGINEFLSSIWGIPFGKIILIIISFVAGVAIGFAIIISIFIFKACTTTPKGDETLVILGCQVKGTRPSLMLTERLDAAKSYLDEHENATCVLSGGKGDDEGISEALCMYNYLVEQGVSSDRLFLEDKSTSTRENLQYSLDIIKENNLNENVAIVTNEFHEYRAFKIAEKLDIKPSAVPAHTHWWLFSTYFVREWYGVIYEWTGMTK